MTFSSTDRGMTRTSRHRAVIAAAILTALLLAGCSRGAPHQTAAGTLTSSGYGDVSISDVAVADGHQITVNTTATPTDQEATAAADRAAGIVWQEWVGTVAMVRVVQPGGGDVVYSASDLQA